MTEHVCENEHPPCACTDTTWVSVQGSGHQPGVQGFFCPAHNPTRET